MKATLIIYKSGQCGNYIASNISRFILEEETTYFKNEFNEYLHLKGYQISFDANDGNQTDSTSVIPSHFNTLMKTHESADGMNPGYNIQNYRLMLNKIKRRYDKVVVINNNWNMSWSNTLGAVKKDMVLNNHLSSEKLLLDQYDTVSGIDELNVAKHYAFLSRTLKNLGMDVFDVDFKELLIDKNIELYNEMCSFFNKQHSLIGYNNLANYVDKNIELMETHGFIISE
jgi:hypothetical protein